jgi:hypothetical protein
MTRRWTLALLLTILVLTSRTASAGQEGEPTPGHLAVAPAATPAVGSSSVTASDGDGRGPHAATRNDAFCLTCHGDPALETRLADGSTLSLHVDVRALPIPLMDCRVALPVTPTAKHTSPADAFRRSPTTGCAPAQMCVGCHLAAAGDYAGSVHGAPVLSGAGGGATCNDCHSPDGSGHSTSRVADFSAARTAGSVTENCGRCHEDALATYRRTAHGKLGQLANQRRAATCTDCHGVHAVRAVDDPSGALAPARLALVCQECHRGADEQFAGEWLGHEASASPSGLADYVHRGVVTLMAVGVCFGLTHITLDFLRTPRRPGGSQK